MIQKVLIFVICILLVGISIPITKSAVVNDSANTNSGPILDIMIYTKLSLLSLSFIVENKGNATVHNVSYSGLNIAGKVICNSRAHLIIDELEPGSSMYGESDRFIGYGIFIAEITVTCDEGHTATDSIIGIVFGPFNFIP